VQAGGGRNSNHAALFDGKDFDLAVAENGTIADRLADQRTRDGRYIGDRSRSGIGFVLADNAESLPPTVGTAERSPANRTRLFGARPDPGSPERF
jgi:hypothetical protein